MSHPLVEKQIKGIESWTEWRKLWDAATYAEQLHGLLHIGFNIETRHYRESNERVRFYLAIADGHSAIYPRNLQREDDPTSPHAKEWSAFGYLNRPSLRQEVAHKAFKTLCLTFFRQQDGICPWSNAVRDEETLQAILNFFLQEPEFAINQKVLSNLDRNPDSRLNEIVREFLLCVVREGWLNGRDRGPETVEYFRKARPRFVEILYRMDKLSFLLHKEFEPDDACLAALETIAMKQGYGRPSGQAIYREPKSLEEACAFGSKAAQTLIVIRIMRRETERLEEIERLEEQRDAAAQKLERLLRA
jgi:hypothetical protein